MSIPNIAEITPNFKEFTPWEWHLIHAANCIGLDKKTYEERIQWGKENLNCLEAYQEQAEEEEGTGAQYYQAVHAIREIQAGRPTGVMIELDSIASGTQFMSLMMGCPVGMYHTGLICPDTRTDPYTECYNMMNTKVEGPIEYSRAIMKDGFMTK